MGGEKTVDSSKYSVVREKMDRIKDFRELEVRERMLAGLIHSIKT